MATLLFIAIATAGTVPVLELDGGLDPASAAYLVDGLHAAEDAHAPAVILRIDTPGGLETSARDVVAAELAADVPVVAWVGPSGARAASAGMFVAMGAHVVAMAPGTTLGAAHPVTLFGKPDDEMSAKIENDAAAWARALAARRGRPQDWAEAAVRQSIAATDGEAVAVGMADVVAADLPTLLRAIDGRVVALPGGDVRLAVADATPEVVPMPTARRVAHTLADPDLIFLLGMIGVLAVYVELSHPGLSVPGIVGVVALVVAAMGLSILPYNVGGLILLVLGAILCGVEAFVGASGLLALSGVAAVVLGGLLVFDVAGTDLRVDPGLLAAFGVLGGALVVGVASLVARARARRVVTGMEGLLGEEGEVLVGGRDGGRVRVLGEDWRAHWRGGLGEGAHVRVVAVHGLSLDVEPVEGGVS